MNDKLMDALAQWPGSVKFGGKYAGMEDKLNAELERRREKGKEQDNEVLANRLLQSPQLD